MHLYRYLYINIFTYIYTYIHICIHHIFISKYLHINMYLYLNIHTSSTFLWKAVLAWSASFRRCTSVPSWSYAPGLAAGESGVLVDFRI